MSPTPESERSGTPLQTEVIYHVNDLVAAPPEWRIRDVQNMANISTLTAGCMTLGVAVGPRECIVDQLLAKCHDPRSRCRTPWISSWPRQTSFEQCTNVFNSARTRRRNLPSSERVWESDRITHILRVHGHTILQVYTRHPLTRHTCVVQFVHQRAPHNLYAWLKNCSVIFVRQNKCCHLV